MRFAFAGMCALALTLPAAPAWPQDGLAALTAAAQAGDAQAQYRLAEAYLAGRGVKQDDAAAAQWAKKSADQGNADAEAMLAGFYLDGIGVAKDEAKAIPLIDRAMGQKNGMAFYLGARMARARTQVPDHDDRANFLLRVGAYLGDRASMAALGEVFARGLGVAPDPVQAHVWFGVAVAAFGSGPVPPPLVGAFRAVALTPEQEKAAQARIGQCVNSGLRDCGPPELPATLVK